VPELPKVDEFSFVLAAGALFILTMAFMWGTPTETMPVVKETAFDFSAAPGEKISFEFTITGATTLTAVNLTKTGEISNWMTFNKNNFDVRESTKVAVTIRVPDNTTEGAHSGRVYVNGIGGRDSFSINIEVVKGRRETARRPIPLGDFTVGYYEGTDMLDSKADIRVSKGYFSSREIDLASILSSDRMDIVTGGNIHLLIDDTNSIGDLIVEFNGEEIYRRKVGPGELVIPIDKDYIQRSNTVTIKTVSPGAMFWTNSYYDIVFAEFNIDYKGAFAKTFDTTLSENEVDKFKQFELFYRVKGYSAPLPLLMIKVNNQITYWDRPPLVIFEEDLSEDMSGNPLYLNEGTNTITFLFEENAEYTIADAMLTVVYYE